MSATFIRFTVVGVAATLTTYSVLIVLVEGLAFAPVVASAFGFVCGAVINYLLNYYFTFKSTQRHQVVLPKFVLIIMVGFFFNAAVMYFAETLLAVHYVLAQLFAVVIVLIWSFLANRFWTFV